MSAETGSPGARSASGPLSGTKVLELAAVGPVPFAGMALADLGAEVTRIDRLPGADPYAGAPGAGGPMGRGRRSISVDLRTDEGVAVALRLCQGSDVLLEGFRPGVTERMGLGPDVALGHNARLVYARMTGFGQEGPLRDRAGHDITYLATSGVLHALGESSGAPLPPLNLVADFGGGAMSLVTSVLAALLERERSGKGQVLDVSMADAAGYLATMTRHMLHVGAWTDARGVNLLDGGAPHYRCYQAADGRYVAVGALEPQFWRTLLAVLGLEHAGLPDPKDRSSWPLLTERVAAVLATRTRDEWATLGAERDACLAPVLTLAEAPGYPHNRERGSYQTSAGVSVAVPPGRMSRTAVGLAPDPPSVGEDTEAVLLQAGLGPDQIAALRERGVVGG